MEEDIEDPNAPRREKMVCQVLTRAPRMSLRLRAHATTPVVERCDPMQHNLFFLRIGPRGPMQDNRKQPRAGYNRRPPRDETTLFQPKLDRRSQIGVFSRNFPPKLNSIAPPPPLALSLSKGHPPPLALVPPKRRHPRSPWSRPRSP